MAKNTGQGFRRGEVKGRSQVYNPQNDTWVKRDTKTGQFMDVKQCEPHTSFKGVRHEHKPKENPYWPSGNNNDKNKK